MVGLVLGPPGAGKSTLLRALAARWHARRRDLVVVVRDPCRDWADWGRARGAVEINGPSAMRAILRARAGAIYRVIPPDDLAAARAAVARGQCLLVDDEADMVARPLPGVTWRDNPYRTIVHYGRHLPGPRGGECHLLAAARRPVGMHPDMIDCASIIYARAVHAPRTRAQLTDICGPPFVAAMDNAPPWVFARWTPGGVDYVAARDG